MAPPLVAEASSQLLNYISGSQVSEQSKFPSFRHYRPHATVMAKVAHNTGKIKCISANAPIHLELNNFTQANYHKRAFALQPRLRNAMERALCAARLLWLIRTHTHEALQPYYIYFIVESAEWAIKQHWCGGVAHQVFIACRLNYLRTEIFAENFHAH